MLTYKQKLKRNIKFFYLSSFFNGLVFIIPVWVAFQRRFLTYEQISLLWAAGMAVTMFLELPSGALADLIGRKMTLILGVLTRIFSYTIQGLSINPLMFIIGFLFNSIGTALISGADEALLFDTLKEIKSEGLFQKIMGKNSLFFQSALAIGTLFGGYLYEIFAGLPYLVEAGAEVIAICMFFLMVEPKIDTVKFTLSSYIKQTGQGLKEIFKNSYIKRVSLFYVLVGGITWSSQYFFNQPLATDLGFTEVQKGWLFSIIRFVNSVVLFRITNIGRLIDKKKAFLLFPLIMAASYLPGFFSTKFLGIFLLAGATFASTARFVILGQFTNEEFESRHRATAVSSLNLLVSLVFILLVSFSGRLMTLYSTKLVYTILGVLSLVLILPLGINLAKNHVQLKNKKLV
jgi:MFS family permease